MTSNDRHYFTYTTLHGPLSICATNRGICGVVFEQGPLDAKLRASELTNTAATQIQEFLAGKRHTFDIALDLTGTTFQKLVWAAVCDIPYGQTSTATEIAALMGKGGAHRSIGAAIRRNPTPILVPTHRVLLPNDTGKMANLFSGLRAIERQGSRENQ